MAFSLYECMTAVGLQHHYARFTSVGVCHAAQLSVLTMEDYPLLGIRTMEDRTRLFHLVQLVKTLDLENLGYDNVTEDSFDYNVDRGDGDFAADSSFKHVGCGNPNEDVSDGEHENGAGKSKNATTFARPSGVRRRLDFSNESIDHHQKECSCPVGTVHVYASCNRNGGTIVCGCQGSNNHKLDVHSHPSDRHRGENIKPDITGGIFMYSSDTQKSSKYESFHEPIRSPATNSFTNKPFGHKHRGGISRKQRLYTEVDGTFGHIAKPTPVYEARRTAGYNYGLPLSSPLAPNKINKKQTGEQRISVCVRKRPLTRSESRGGEADVVTTPGGECVIVHESKEAVDLTEYILQHRFYLDQVFGEESSNEEVYQRTAYPLVQHMLSGGKATCFAYGQTGAGKTYTMLGSSPGRPGLYAMAARDIFSHLSTTNAYPSLRVHVSFFEIYCGQLYDLLDHRKRLFAREDGQKVVHISGLRDVRVDSVRSLLEVISQGTEERTQGTSGVNPLSSRSHALLQIQLRDPNQQIAGRIWFVDLAGSERASDTKEPDRQSRMEGAEINQSLLALKECIRALDREQSHTPFRQSKLTQVLKDSFVGDSMTCMIANISPGHTATEHTLNTLRYADRVKELRGEGGLKGRRRGKTVPSPKNNQSKSSSSTSSVCTRGKSPPKKPKLGRQSEACCPTTPTRESRVKDVILCSTPKNNRCVEEANTRSRKVIGLENITPVRGCLAMVDKRHGSRGAGERESRRIKNESYGSIEIDSVREQSTRAGLGQGQPVDKQLPSWWMLKEGAADEGNLSLTERELRFYRSEKESQQQKGGRVEEEKKWIGLRRQVERSKVENPRETGSQKTGERDKERERHLKKYHEQLQQFITSSTSSSAQLFSPSTCPSITSSTKGSLPYSVSPSSLRHPSRLSVSPHTYQGLEEVLEAYAARVEARVDANRGHSPRGEIHLQSKTSTVRNHSNDEDHHGGVSEGLRVSWEGTEAGYGQSRHKTERKRSVETTGEASVRKEDMRPSDMEEGKRKWAWVATTEKEASNTTTGAISTNVEERFSYSCGSEDRREVGVEGLNASDDAADGVWSTEQGQAADNYNNDDSNNLFSHPPFESPSQRAPAERPLSPAWEHANAFLTPAELSNASPESTYSKYNTNILPVPLRNTSEVGPSNSHRQNQPWFGVNAQISHAQSATLPLTATIMHTGSKTPADPAYSQTQNQPDPKAKMSPDETYSDSLSYIVDPLTVSLLQVDQQAATVSFLQGDNNSLCLPQDHNGEDNRRKVDKKRLPCVEMVEEVIESEDKTFFLSHLELPQAKTQHTTTSETVTDTNQTEHREDIQIKICGKGRNKLLIPEVMLENNQKLETTPTLGNKASTLKPSTSAATPTSFMSPSVQHFGNASSPSLHNPVTNAAQIVYAPNGHKSSSVTTPRSENVSGRFNTMQSQCHTAHSKHSSNSLQLNNPAELNGQGSTSNQLIRPTVHLVTVDDLEEAKWCIVEAHLEQLKEMETLCHKEGKLLCQQPDMAFGEYVHRLEEILERKAQCVRSMRAQLQPYLKPL